MNTQTEPLFQDELHNELWSALLHLHTAGEALSENARLRQQEGRYAILRPIPTQKNITPHITWPAKGVFGPLWYAVGVSLYDGLDIQLTSHVPQLLWMDAPTTTDLLFALSRIYGCAAWCLQAIETVDWTPKPSTIDISFEEE